MRKEFLCIAVTGFFAGGWASVPTVPLSADAATSLSGKTIAPSVVGSTP